MQEPAILSANTYFWRPGLSAHQRRSNEEKNLSAVLSYLQSLGFTAERSYDSVTATNGNIHVEFSYSETCTRVYKSLSVTRDNGKSSNITAIRKLAQGVAK